MLSSDFELLYLNIIRLSLVALIENVIANNRNLLPKDIKIGILPK